MPKPIYGPADLGLTKRYEIAYPYKLISKSNSKHRFLDRKYREFEDSLAKWAAATCGCPMLKAGWVVIRPVYQTRVHVDPSNIPKSVCDALKKGRVYTDDKEWAVTVCPVVYGAGPSTIEIWA